MTARANAVDRHVGARLKTRREARRIDETGLARLTGMSAAQIERYERGIRRIAAPHLFAFAKALHAEIGFFYNGIEAARRN